MTTVNPETDQLFTQAAEGSAGVRNNLLLRHRDRVCRRVASRLDKRLAAR